MAEILQGGKRDAVQSDSGGAVAAWAVTNHTEDRTIDCDGAVGVIGDGLGSLIKELIRKGIIDGTVA
jgi:hypothetical protein